MLVKCPVKNSDRRAGVRFRLFRKFKEQFQVLNQYVDISIAGGVMNSWAIGTPTVLVMIMEVLTAMLD